MRHGADGYENDVLSFSPKPPAPPWTRPPAVLSQCAFMCFEGMA